MRDNHPDALPAASGVPGQPNNQIYMARVSTKKTTTKKSKAAAVAAEAPVTEVPAAAAAPSKPEPMFEPVALVEKTPEPELPAERTVDAIKSAAA